MSSNHQADIAKFRFLSIRLDLTFLNKDLADHRAYIIRLAVTERDSVGKSNGQGGEDRNVNKRELHGGLERWLRNSGFSPTSCDPPQNFYDWLRRACSPLSVARFIFFYFRLIANQMYYLDPTQE